MVADGAGVAEVAVDAPELSTGGELVLVVAVAFTNFFEGALAGGVASDFILSRAFLAAS